MRVLPRCVFSCGLGFGSRTGRGRAKNRLEIEPERGGELGCRAEREVDVVVEYLVDVRTRHVHPARQLRLRDLEFGHALNNVADEGRRERVDHGGLEGWKFGGLDAWKFRCLD